MKNTIAVYILLALLFIEIKAVSILKEFISANDCLVESIIFLDENGRASIAASDLLQEKCDACDVYLHGQRISELSCEDVGKPLALEIIGPDLYELVCWVTVKDTISPILSSCQDTSISATLEDVFNWPDSFAGVSAIDICEIDTLFGVVCGSEPQIKCPDTAMVLKIRWTAIDINGNRNSKDQRITFMKTSIMEIDFPRDTTLDCSDNSILNVLPTPTHNGVVLSQFHGLKIAGPELLDSAVFCEGNRVYKYRWRIQDPCSNVLRSDTFEVKFIDTIGPECMFLEDIDTHYIDPLSCSFVLDSNTFQEIVIEQSNCFKDSIVFEQLRIDGQIINRSLNLSLLEGCYNIEWTGSDDCWNFSNCSYKLQVLDTTRPGILCPNDICRVITFDEFFGSTGNCDEVVYSLPDTLFPIITASCCPLMDTIIDTLYDDSDCDIYTGAPNEDNAVVLQIHAIDSCGNRTDTCSLRFCVEQTSRKSTIPNSSDQLNHHIFDGLEFERTFQIFNMHGILVYSSNENRRPIDNVHLNDLPTGVYIIVQGRESKRFFVP